MGKRPRSQLDILKPNVSDKVFAKQERQRRVMTKELYKDHIQLGTQCGYVIFHKVQLG